MNWEVYIVCHSICCYFAFQGRESFASYESLEQLHRLIFILGITHVSYNFIAIALAMIKVGIFHISYQSALKFFCLGFHILLKLVSSCSDIWLEDMGK